MVEACVDLFVETLSRSELLEPEHIQQLTKLQESHGTPRELAHELIRRDWLTPFQVNQLFLGRGDDLILGPYVLLERLGEGGMGKVFKARQQKLRRVVALKIIRNECMSNPKAIPRFEREIRSAAQLSHPNIVHAYDADNVGGIYYFAMEYVEGVDLSRLIKQQGPLRVDQACDYIYQAALGLQHAHERGMVHRDIKPANLLVTRNDKSHGSGSGLHVRPGQGPHPWGIIKILDMGLARWERSTETLRSVTHLTQMGSLIGTPEFIAPEQARDCRNTDIRGDLYSLGCTFYYLLAGRVPFPEGTLTEKLLHHQLDEPEPVEQVRTARLLENTPGRDPSKFQALVAVPTAVENIVRKLMAKQPENRFQTPAELAEALQTLPKKQPAVSIALPVSRDDEPKKSKLPAAIPATAEPAVVADFADLRPSKKAKKKLQQPAKRSWFRRMKYVLAGFGFLVLMLAILSRKDDNGDQDESPKSRISVAQKQWDELLERKAELTKVAWRQALMDYRRHFADDALAEEAYRSLTNIRSPFDRLQSEYIPLYNRFAWQPDELVAVFGRPQLRRWQAVTAISASPDGRILVAGHRDGRLRVWKVAEPQKARELFVHRDRITAIAFSPDGESACSAGDDGEAVVRDVRSGDERFRLKYGKPISAVAFSPKDDFLVTGGQDGQIVFWSLQSGKQEHKIKGAFDLTSLAFTPDGETLIWAGADGSIRWTHLESGEEGSFSADAPVLSLQVHPQGRMVAWSDNKGRVVFSAWNGSELSSSRAVKAHDATRSIAFSPCGRMLVSVGEDRVVNMWDVESGKKFRDWRFRWPIPQVIFAPEGRHVATANANGTVYVLRLTRPPRSNKEREVAEDEDIGPAD